MLVGAYTFALLVPHELGRVGTASGSWPVIPAVMVAMAAAALLGLLLGGPTVRLRGDYLAIVTIAVAEILRLGTRSLEMFGQSFGVIQFSQSFNDLMPGFVSGWAESLDVSDGTLWLFLVTWLVVLVVFLLLRLMIHSPWGRVLRAIREDEDAARALGKNAFWYKLQSLMIGGAIGGLAGVLFALDLAQISPQNFLPLVTFFAWTAMILGGAGTVGGPIAGSIVFWVVLTQTSELAADLFPSWSTQAVSGTRFVLMGALIMALIVFRPEGLFGKREELSLEIQ
jgi:neutral amino acid transport system permease protein